MLLEIFRNWSGFFAHTSFKWTNNASYNAGVTCAIIGICNKEWQNDEKEYIQAKRQEKFRSSSPYLNQHHRNDFVYKSNDIYRKVCRNVFRICLMTMDSFLDQYSKDEILADYPKRRNWYEVNLWFWRIYQWWRSAIAYGLMMTKRNMRWVYRQLKYRMGEADKIVPP